MEKIIDGYLTGFGSVCDMERLEDYYDEDFTDAGMSEIRFRDDVPSVEECDTTCGELSGEIFEFQ